MILLLGIGLLTGLAACLFDPFAGMLTLMGINIIQPGQLYPIFHALHTERIMVAVTIVMVVVRGYKLVFPKLAQRMLLFYGACLASVPLAFWLSNSITSVWDFGKTMILSMLLMALTTSRRRLRAVLLTFSGLVGYLAATGLLQYVEGTYQVRMNVDRLVGLTSASANPDSLGLTIATALPIAFLFTLRGNAGWLRWTMRGLCGLLLTSLLLTGSRGSMLTLLLMLTLAILISRRRLVLLPAALVLGLVTWSVLPAQYQARYMTVNHLQHDASYQNRITSWEGGWHMFLHNPLTGIGIGDYTYANGARYWPRIPRVYLDAHSLYFKILGELGLLGLITFAAFLAAFFNTNRVLRRQMLARSETPPWLRYYPAACNLALIELLYCGYAYHDVYRTTWYFLAAVSASLWLILRREAAPAACGGEALPEPALAMETA
ncbi:MAG: O-antigen ligase family protein [Terriglobales bacterium]